jgi:hypothetical protein
MDYQKHYDLLIERAKTRVLGGYVEVHHILPKCLGGGNDKSNLVQLTPEEHYVAHQLLFKIHPSCKGLSYAMVMMTLRHGERRNKLYGWIKRRAAQTRKTAPMPWLSDPGYKARHQAATKKAQANPDVKKRRAATMKLVYANPEFGKKISAANTGRKMSAEARANIAEAGRNRAPRKFSEQAKKNMAEARKKTWAERRERGEHLLIAQKIKESRIKNGTYSFSEEHRANIGKAGRGRVPWNKGTSKRPVKLTMK